jgi:hypothetical protein
MQTYFFAHWSRSFSQVKPSVLGTVLFLSAAMNLAAQAHHVGYKLDEAKCSAAWAKASPNGQAISLEQASSYVDDANIVDGEGDGDGSISFEEFKTACADGLMLSPDFATFNQTEGGKTPYSPGPAGSTAPVSAQTQNNPISYDAARLDAFGKAATVEVLGVELPNATTKDTHVAILLSGINVTAPLCSRRIWHIPRNKIVSSSLLKDVSCPGGNVTRYLVSIDAVPIEEMFVARPLRDLIGPTGGAPEVLEAKGQDPEWKGKTCELQRPDGSVHRGKCEDVCKDKDVTRPSPVTSTADGVCNEGGTSGSL